MPSDPTINERVAIACGLEHKVSAGVVLLSGPEGWLVGFFPDRDADDSILAAEKFGLFRMGGAYDCTMKQLASGQPWVVIHRYGKGRQQREVGRGTFCEAICSAILRLAESGAAGDNEG